MHGDVFEQPRIATTNREANVLAGAQFILDACAPKIRRIRPTASARLRRCHRRSTARQSPLLHIGIDKFDTVLLCHRYPVITVEHKIDIANLVKIHGRQADIVVKGAIDLAPATNSGILGGQEGIVEIAKPPDAADDFSTGTSCMPRRMKPRNFRLSRTTSQAMRSVFRPTPATTSDA